MSKHENITGIVSWLAGVAIGLMVVMFPLGYFIISYGNMIGSLETEAEINARIISQIIGADPEMWQFEHVRIQEYLSRRPKKGQAEIRRVIGPNNEVIAESADALPAPRIVRSVGLFDSGVVVGRIEIVQSLRPLLMQTLLLAFVVLPLGAVVFAILRILPIRAIRRSEEALRNERDTAQQYLDVAGVMLIALDADQRVTMINRKGCEILGYAEDRIVQKNWFDHFVPERTREEAKAVFQLLKTTRQERPAVSESPVLTVHNNERIVAWQHIVLTDAAGTFAGTLSSGEDITERKNLEAQLLHAQKMEAIGVLAGGIAHDFNNVLAVIMGRADLLKISMQKGDPLRDDVEQILTSSVRASQLVKSLLAFGRKQILIPKPVRVSEIVRNVKILLARFLSMDIQLRIVSTDDTLTVRADAGQIELVLMNLATNARDAMPKGGLFTIETDRVTLDHEFVKHHGGAAAGMYARITVSDTGEGMTEATRKKIFDPFFTTKAVGKGTGLGLSMVYGIVIQHHGCITVHSEVNQGTTFRIYLPLMEAAHQDAVKTARPAPLGGTETLLIADDDEAVRTTFSSVLRKAGYTVIEARDGEEAIRLFSEHQRSVQLVILDVIMPNKNGEAVFSEMKGLRPDIHALFISGYTDGIIKEKSLLNPDAHFLSKPASSADLMQKVREALQA